MQADRYGYASNNGNYVYQDRRETERTSQVQRALNFKGTGPNSGRPAHHHNIEFKPFTGESLEKIKLRRVSKPNNKTQIELEPDPYLASGQQLPPVLLRQLPSELIGQPLEDIDPYYADRETFVIISRGKELTRFSASSALCIFGPFHPIRRIVLCILVNPLFSILVMLTIIANCVLMTLKRDDDEEKTEIFFTIVYTTEMGLKVIARGFIADEFTYLRDPWNWLDFTVILMAYLTIGVKDLGNLSVMRTFRVLRALKTVAIVPGMKTIVGAVIDSVKNLKDVVVLTLFSLSVFSLLGLQIYMGVLTQKCILNGPHDMTNEEWFQWCSNETNWLQDKEADIPGSYRLCGNATGAQSCPKDYTCLQGFGKNPDYGYTNFDTFGWALICSFRLMTQDFWEGLYMQVLKTAGSWHIIFFIISIFLGSIYLMNLILAIVAMSYNELQRRAEEEEEAAAEEEAAFLESCRIMEQQERASIESGEQRSFRPSIEIGMMGQSLLAGMFQDESQRPKSNSVHSLKGEQSTGPFERNSNIVSCQMEAKVVEGRWRPPRPSQSAIFHRNSDAGSIRRNSRRDSKGSMNGSIYTSSEYHRYLKRKSDTSTNYSAEVKNEEQYESPIAADLRKRAALIRIVSDDCSERKNSLQANQYALESEISSIEDQANLRGEKYRRNSSTLVGRSFEDSRSLYEKRDSNHLRVEDTLMSRAKSQDLTRKSSTDNRKQRGYHLHVSSMGNRFLSELAICKQPVSIHQYVTPSTSPSPVSFNVPTQMNLAGPYDTNSNRSEESNRSISDRSSSTSMQPNQGLGRFNYPSSLKPPKLSRNLGVNCHTDFLSLDGSPNRLRSYTNVHQLTINSGSQQNIPDSTKHHLSVNNFQDFGSIRPNTRKRSRADVYFPSQEISERSLDKKGSISVLDKNRSQDIHRASHVINSRDNQALIHPSIMARSSFARPPPGFYDGPGSKPLVGSTNRRLSQQEYLRRASNLPRLSMSGNSDIRRLLRLWAHTNPYQWNNVSRSTAGSIVSYNNPTNTINNNNNNYEYSPIPSMANSPRPSSVGSARQAYELISALNRRRSYYGLDHRYGVPIEDNMIDGVSVNMRDKCIAYCLSCLDVLCIWECCGAWLQVQKLISIVVFDPFTELFIILCIIINTLFMALDSDDIDQDWKTIFERGNYFFTTTFAVEAAMKIIALSPKFYFREGWNVFDSIIVGLSLLELGLEGVYGLSVLRSFRLLRVFKLAKSWPTLNLLISIMGKAIGDLGNLTFVVAIIVFIFAVMGMQLFGNKYVAASFPNQQVPRWNFNDFMHSFMIVFRILCAEWIEPMWDCLQVGGWPCIPFFLIAVTVGNLVVLNLFLALLLASFGASNLSSPQTESVDTKKLDEAIQRFKRFGRWIRRKLVKWGRAMIRYIRRRLGLKGRKNSKQSQSSSMRGTNISPSGMSHIVAISKAERAKNVEKKTELLINRIKTSSHSEHHNLSNLARIQAQRYNGSISDFKSCNYHYDQSFKHHMESGHSSSLPNRTDMMGQETHKVYQRKAFIPIIVNEASDMDPNSSEQLADDQIGSVDGSQPLSSSETKRSSNGDTFQPHFTNRTNGMEPIREDSRDAETSESISLCEREQQYCESMKCDSPTTIISKGNEYHVVDWSSQAGSLNRRPKSAKNESDPSGVLTSPTQAQDMEEEDERTLQYVEVYLERCICLGIICLRWFLFRRFVRKIVEHRYFDQCILALIVVSSGVLALEDKHLNERPLLKRTLDTLDTLFTIIFSLEMISKWLAFGFRRYFSNIWSWLDFFIVMVSFINLMASIFGTGKIQALKTMRTLRAMRGLRPLRALQRFQGMRVVVNALIQAIPSIFNVLLVCLIFWLIFSIMAVQMFGGKFWRCVDINNDPKELVDIRIAANKFECLGKNLTWINPQINFDNVLNAYLALFQIATFQGWIEIMNSAVDARGKDEQPVREANIFMYLYFVFFVVVGSFFTLNLFIGVIIDNFNEQKKKTGGSLEIFMTEDQKKYYHAMKKMKSKKPVKAMTRPKFKVQAFLFDVTTSKKFDMFIMVIICTNMFIMSLEHYGQSQEFTNFLENLNLIYIGIFTVESLCKMFAMRHYYFREHWNIFDLVVVSLSIIGVLMKEYVAKYFVSPTLLRVARVVKVGRVLRLVKGAKGIRTLLFALAMSMPALFNICLLLFMLMFIYAIFGMSFFMNVRRRSGIDEIFNFDTFFSSIIILFEMSTSAGWDQVLDPLMDEENDCLKPDPSSGVEGTCGNKPVAVFYLVTYVIATFLIIINMYIAVILENYSQATEDVQEGLTDDDYEMYYEIWQHFDPDGTQYLPFERLSDFLHCLEEPLRIPKPNHLAIVVLDINIYEGNLCYCVDILDAITKYFFARKGLIIQVNEHLERVQSAILHETSFAKVTTTYLLKREHYSAKLIQNCWRKWRASRGLTNAASPKAIEGIELT